MSKITNDGLTRSGTGCNGGPHQRVRRSCVDRWYWQTILCLSRTLSWQTLATTRAWCTPQGEPGVLTADSPLSKVCIGLLLLTNLYTIRSTV